MIFAYLFYFGSFAISIINPFWGLVGLIFSVLIRFQDRFPEIESIKPFSLLFLGMVIGCIVNRDKLSQHHWKQDKLLIGMLLMSIFGLLIMSPRDVVYETWVFISSLAFYYFASRILQERKQFVILFAVMSACIVYMGYEAIQDIMLHPKDSIFIDPRNGRWQGMGYYANANEFGQLMISTLPFLFAALLMKNNIIIKIIAIGFIALLVYVVGGTESRTVMVLLGMMVVLTLILRRSGNVVKKLIQGSFVGIILFTALSFAPGPIQERLGTLTNVGDDSSFQGRTRSWGHGFDMVSWYPITGVGKNQWMNYHGLMPHNSYVQIMAELGPIGIVLFLSIIRLSFLEFRPFFTDTNIQIESQSNGEQTHPIWGKQEQLENKEEVSITAPKPIDMETKTVVIAVVVVFIAWLIYIFVGNQGYSVWTYFYIGLCAAVRNLYDNKNEP